MKTMRKFIESAFSIFGSKSILNIEELHIESSAHYETAMNGSSLFVVSALDPYRASRNNQMSTMCKIGEHQHVVQLQRNGIVFMNTLKYFWEIEDGGLRGDKLDGVNHMANGLHAEVRTPDGKLIPADITSWTLQARPAEPEKINLFCMYAIHSEIDAPSIDPRATKFGESSLVMTQPNEFMSRLAAAARELGRSFDANLVNYVPNHYVGDVGLFSKTDHFAYQSEWRFAMFHGSGNPITLELGDLSDISMLIESRELPDFIHEYRTSINSAGID